jgi:ATP-dependent DNA ligase
MRREKRMIEFVDLMESRSLGILEDEQDMDEFWFSDQWLMEPIYVGIRYQCLIDDDNTLKFLGKRKNYKQQNSMYLLTDLIEEIKSYSLPKNTLFEGYLTFSNDQQKVFRFLKSSSFNESCQDVEFYLTDLIYFDNKALFDLPLFDRRSRLHSFISNKKIVKLQEGHSSKKKEIYSRLKDEFKIFLFKDLESPYTFNQSMSWRILKTPKSFYMVVLGFVENDDEKFRGMVLALEGGQFKNGKLIKIMNVPVHSTNSRIYLCKEKQKVLGKVFEILALEDAKGGKYQESRFVKIREDKKQEECIYSEEE